MKLFRVRVQGEEGRRRFFDEEHPQTLAQEDAAPKVQKPRQDRLNWKNL